MRPAIFFPFKTLPGVVVCPIEPGALSLSDCPWVLGPPAKCQRLTTPAKPFPLEVPETEITSPLLKMSEAFIISPTLSSFLSWVTTQGPATTLVTGTLRPSTKVWLIPPLLAKIVSIFLTQKKVPEAPLRGTSCNLLVIRPYRSPSRCEKYTK